MPPLNTSGNRGPEKQSDLSQAGPLPERNAIEPKRSQSPDGTELGQPRTISEEMNELSIVEGASLLLAGAGVLGDVYKKGSS